MIALVLVPAPEEVPSDGPGGNVRYRRLPPTLEETMTLIAGEPCGCVILPHPGPVNGFALSRRLDPAHGPRVCLVAKVRPDLCFWAERCGCELFSDVEAALAAQGTCP